MAQTTTPVQILADLADEMSEQTAEVLRLRIDALANELDPADLRGEAAAAVVVLIAQMAEKLQVEETCEFIRQIVIPSMVWIWYEPPKSITTALGVIETLAQLSWLRPGDNISVPDDFAEITAENAALLARAAIAVSARGAGIFGDPRYGDRLRTLC
jgi:hypothetical protein